MKANLSLTNFPKLARFRAGNYKILVVVSIIFLSIITSIDVTAAVINVPADYPTIQQGINASADGDTVLVQPETYVENINFNGHNIVLGSLFFTTQDTSYISSTIIDGNQAGTVVKFNGNFDNTTIIAGFTIQNGRDHNYSAGIFCPEGANPSIINNIIRGNRLITEFLAGAGISCQRSSPMIANNLISQNISLGYPPGMGGGIGCFDHSNPLIRGNVIVNNSADYGYGGGIFCYDSSPIISGNIIAGNISHDGLGGGISCLYSDPIIINNTICYNTSMLGGGLYSEEPVPIVRNTIIRDNVAEEDVNFYVTPPIITYSDIGGGWAGEGNIDCDPLFCDPPSGNYYLYAGSCCIGAGQNGVDIGALGVGCYDICGNYVVGDFNGSGAFNIADIVESFSNLKTGLPDPALLCECPPNSGNQWAVAMDVNNSCGFNVADIVSGFSYLKTGSPEPTPCGICPPGEP